MRQLQVMMMMMMVLMDSRSVTVSYNQPKFSPCATWNSTGYTFANSSPASDRSVGIYVDANNTVYVSDEDSDRVRVWLQGNSTPHRIISSGLNDPRGVFATPNGDIYVDNGESNGRVDKWTLYATSAVTVMSITNKSYGLFVDINNTLYSSIESSHIVFKKSLHGIGVTPNIAAGNFALGNLSYQLYSPRGIFIDTNFDLYVADQGNNRIQLFHSGQLNGITVAGTGATGSAGRIGLSDPAGVVLDADGNLFIVDSGNNRIMGSGPNGFRCIAGCFGPPGSTLTLDTPRSLSFDSYGNIFVTDRNNHRIQKFLLASNYCSKCVPSFIQYVTIETIFERNLVIFSCTLYEPRKP